MRLWSRSEAAASMISTARGDAAAGAGVERCRCHVSVFWLLYNTASTRTFVKRSGSSRRAVGRRCADSFTTASRPTPEGFPTFLTVHDRMTTTFPTLLTGTGALQFGLCNGRPCAYGGVQRTWDLFLLCCSCRQPCCCLSKHVPTLQVCLHDCNCLCKPEPPLQV